MTLKISIIPVTAYQQNCSLIWCDETKKAAVIDPGGEINKILDMAKSCNVKIEKIFITHGHLDHAGAAGELAVMLNIPIEGPEKADIFWIDRITQDCADSSFPPTAGFTPTRWLVDNDVINIGNIEMQVLHCPGHTPGHVVFYEKSANIAFVGDVLFQNSIGRTDFPMGNHDDLLSSIKNKLWPLGDDVTFISGHGGISTFGAERKNNPFVSDEALA